MDEAFSAGAVSFAARPGYRIDHIGIIVRDLDAAAAAYQMLGFSAGAMFDAPAHGIRALVLPAGQPGQSLELFTPVGDGAAARWLDKRGEGLHHVAFAVADIAAELTRLRAAGVRLVDNAPRLGLHGWPVAFLHPVGGAGVLIELVQPPKEPTR